MRARNYPSLAELWRNHEAISQAGGLSETEIEAARDAFYSGAAAILEIFPAVRGELVPFKLELIEYASKRAA